MAGRGRRADDRGENPPYAFLAVSDTGTGMDDKTKSRIFEPFFTTKEPGMGTGLGLATVRAIVEQHRGHINVDSEPGKGTTFSVFLPLIRNEAPHEEFRSRDAPFPRGTETLLLAEDECNVRESLTVLLERQGYRVIEAADGDEALEKFMQHEADIDALILDVVMPRKNGKEVYEIISKGAPDIKALFISGYTNDTIAEKGIVEAYNVVQKPLLFHEFLKTLRDVLD
jgi:CheY-like chemotaxis protein